MVHGRGKIACRSRMLGKDSLLVISSKVMFQVRLVHWRSRWLYAFCSYARRSGEAVSEKGNEFIPECICNLRRLLIADGKRRRTNQCVFSWRPNVIHPGRDPPLTVIRDGSRL